MPKTVVGEGVRDLIIVCRRGRLVNSSAEGFLAGGLVFCLVIRLGRPCLALLPLLRVPALDLIVS